MAHVLQFTDTVRPLDDLGVQNFRVSAESSVPLSSSRQFMNESPPPTIPSVQEPKNLSSPLSTHMRQIEKDIDNSTEPVRQSTGQYTTTGSALSKLLGSGPPISPSLSRTTSYLSSGSRSRNPGSGTISLFDHLYTRGLLGGRHSDITVIAFGNRYSLHRLILDRSPFFANAFSEPWLESSSKEISLNPEQYDVNITQSAFELTLKHIYGGDITSDQDEEAVGLFAAGSWLEMSDLVESSIKSILRQMEPKNLGYLVKLVTSNDYGRGGQRILASAKAMLCRTGWNMPLKYWDLIPADIIREMISGDGFFIYDEWDRWVLAVRILDRRLKQVASEIELFESNDATDIRAPSSSALQAIRFDHTQRQSKRTDASVMDEMDAKWVSLYTHSDIEPLLVLLEEGIYYAHLDFERLQYIRQACDPFNVPLVPEKLVTNALWLSIELRQKVQNAKDTDLELGLSQVEDLRRPSFSRTVSDPQTQNVGGGATSKDPKSGTALPNALDHPSTSLELNQNIRKFWIPSRDTTMVMGGASDTNTSGWHPNPADRHSTITEYSTLQRNISHSPSASEDASPAPRSASVGTHFGQKTYSCFPPFRFSAEFPHPKTLKMRKRIYSRNVFYAGSLWNIYVQKVKTSKGIQLGVYLHRAKENESEAGSGGLVPLTRTVDERIGVLESQISLSGRANPVRQSTPTNSANLGGDDGEISNEIDREATVLSGTGSQQHPTSSETNSSTPTRVAPGVDDSESDSSLDTVNMPNLRLSHHFSRGSTSLASQKPALSTYIDARPTIKTYFKIYSPSKGGRFLSVYESAPDQFNFSQSWGWRSTTLMLDDGFEDDEIEGTPTKKSKEEGKLRFCIVIGNL